jgi:hypothetical protein
MESVERRRKERADEFPMVDYEFKKADKRAINEVEGTGLRTDM